MPGSTGCFRDCDRFEPAARDTGRCPLRVIHVDFGLPAPCPPFTASRPNSGHPGRSETCQKRSLFALPAERYLALVSGRATARAVLTNDSAIGLSVRFFKVMMAIVPRAFANSTGNAWELGRGLINAQPE
jgi:hypothetical protein